MPSPSVTPVRTKPVSVFLPVTVTPGIAAFWSSVIRPVMLPVVCCANAGELSTSAQSASAAQIILFIPAGLPLGAGVESECPTPLRWISADAPKVLRWDECGGCKGRTTAAGTNSRSQTLEMPDIYCRSEGPVAGRPDQETAPLIRDLESVTKCGTESLNGASDRTSNGANRVEQTLDLRTLRRHRPAGDAEARRLRGPRPRGAPRARRRPPG